MTTHLHRGTVHVRPQPRRDPPMATDLAGAMADTSKLAKFDGKDVVRTTIAVTNAGDGLSDALSIEPREFHHGEEVFVVLKCSVSKITLRPLADAPDLLIREHTFKAGDATIVSGDLVEAYVAEQAAKIETVRRRAKGEFTLEDEALEAEHAQGQHPDLRPGCPSCDAEAAAAAAEASDDAPAAPTPIGKARGASKKAAPAT